MCRLNYTCMPFTSGMLTNGCSIHVVEPLYKGQVGDGSFVTYTVEPLYKGQVGDGSSDLLRGCHYGKWKFRGVPTCPLFRGYPPFRVSTIGGSIVAFYAVSICPCLGS